MLKITGACVKGNIMSMDIVAPIYWWMDFDSTNLAIDCDEGPIGEKDFTLDDFSCEYFVDHSSLLKVIDILNNLRHEYELTNDPKIKKAKLLEIAQLIPVSYNWKKFVTVDIDKALKVAESKRGSNYFEWKVFEDKLIRTIISFRPHKMVQHSQKIQLL